MRCSPGLRWLTMFGVCVSPQLLFAFLATPREWSLYSLIDINLHVVEEGLGLCVSGNSEHKLVVRSNCWMELGYLHRLIELLSSTHALLSISKRDEWFHSAVFSKVLT